MERKGPCPSPAPITCPPTGISPSPTLGKNFAKVASGGMTTKLGRGVTGLGQIREGLSFLAFHNVSLGPWQSGRAGHLPPSLRGPSHLWSWGESTGN